jgi:hypothetical protein
MMTIIKCESCNNDIAEKAATCSKCGHPNKKAGHLSGSQVFFSLVFSIGALWWWNHDRLDQKTTPKTEKSNQSASAIDTNKSLQGFAASTPNEIVFDYYYDQRGSVPKHHSHIIADSNGITITDYSVHNGENTYVRNYVTNESKPGIESYYRKNNYETSWGTYFNHPGID